MSFQSISYKDKTLLSAEECLAIVCKSQLQKQPINLIEYKVEEIGGHLGFLGEYMRLEIVVENASANTQKLFYFLKSLPITNKEQRKIIESLGIFKKEVLIYSKIFSQFGNNSGHSKWRPDCYLARDDLLVFEDLQYKSYKHIPFQFELTQIHIHATLTSLARMHAVSLNYEYNHVNGQRLDKIFDFALYETTVQKDNTWFLAGLSGIKAIAMTSTKYSKDVNYTNLFKEELDHEFSKVFDLVKPTKKFQNVLVHRDLWPNNMMMKFEHKENEDVDYDRPTNCILLDFQICRYLPPAVDVLITTYLLSRRKHLEQYFEDYCKFYYEALKVELEKFHLDIENILNWQEYLLSLKHYKLIALLFTGIYFALTNLPKGVLSDLHQNHEDEYHTYCNHNRDELILKYLKEDDYYRETLLDSVEETLEFIFNIK